MIAAICLLALALALVGASIAAIVYSRTTAPVAPALRTHTVLVNTRRPDDQTIRGVVYGEYADRLTLVDAVHLHQGAEGKVIEVPADGLVHVPTASISWIQEIDPPSMGA